MALKTYTVPVTISRNGTADTESDVPVSGYLKGISVTAGAMEDGSTYTVAIKDKHGMAVYSKSSMTPGTTTTVWADKYNELGTTKTEGELLNTPMAGPIDVTVTASATQGHMSVAYSVYIYYDN